MPKFFKSKSVWLALGVLVLALLPRITTLNGTFITNDEPLYWEWTNGFTQALLNFDWAGTRVGLGYPSVTVFWVHDLGFLVHFIGDMLQGYTPLDFWHRAALDQPFVFDLLGQRRLAMGIANALLIWLIFFQAKKLLGEAIALLGIGLLIFAPFLLADARTMRGDALMSSLMLVSVMAFLLFWGNGRWRQLILSAVALGFAILTKITAIPVAGWAGLAVGVYLLRRRDLTWPARLRWAAMVLAVWGLTTVLIVIIFWPALWVAPLETFEFVRDYAAGSLDGRLNYFWGRLTHDEPIPLFYPNAFLFRATPLVVLGVAMIIGLVIVSAWQLLRRRFVWSQRHSGPVLDDLWQMPLTTRYTLLGLGAYAVIYWLTLDTGALKRDRYLMPVFPAAMFIAAAGLLWLVNRVNQHWPGPSRPALLAGRRWGWGVLALLVSLELSHVLSTHPFYYTYWSPLMGGGRVAMWAMMAESGVDSSALVHLNQQPKAENEKVALLTTRDYAPAYVGKIIRFLNNDPWITADHVMLRLYHFQTEKMDADMLAYVFRQPPEFVVEFQGYTWAWVYPGPSAQYYSGTLLDGKARLLGYNLSDEKASPERPLQLKLFWKNQGYQAPEHIFVRLVDTGGFVWAETAASLAPTFEASGNQPGAIVEGEAQLQIPPGTPPGLYFLKMGVAGAEDEPDVGEFVLPSEGDKILVEKPTQSIQPTVDRPLHQKLTPNLTLLGANLETSSILAPQHPQLLTLYWRVEEDVAESYVISVRLLNASSDEAAYWLGYPARGLYPSSDWQRGDLIRDPWTLDLTQTEQQQSISPGRYTLGLTLFNSATRQEMGQALLGEIEVADRLRLFNAPPIQHPVKAQLGQVVTLLGYNLSQSPLTGGARFTLKLYWQAIQTIPTDYTVFVQVLGPDGTVVGQHDGVPAEGALPTTIWETGEVIPDRHQLDFPTSQKGEYRLIVGMYDPNTGKRLLIKDANGTPLGDYLQLDTFTITETDS